MQIFSQNVEGHLYETLKENWAENPANRCLHIRFSLVEQEEEDWFRKFVAFTQKTIDLTDAQIFLCSDNDVFIISRGLTRKKSFVLISSLMPHFAPASTKGLASLFEIGVDWPKLRAICEQKIENLALENHRVKEGKKESLKPLNVEKVIDMIDKKMISTLEERRASRDEVQIMVVEDDPFSQKLVTSCLQKKYKVHLSADGQGALFNYVNKAPDVLFLDIGLPDISGHKVLEKIFEFDPKAYVIMFSGNGDRDNVLKAVEFGAKGFVAKPFTEEKLYQYIYKSPYVQEKMKKASKYEHSA